MSILLIEDDEKVGRFIKDNLQRENLSVTLIQTYKELEEFIHDPNFTPSLIIMDRLLGNEDSKNLLTKLKQKFNSSLIMFLSALNSPTEKANLLDQGADDYLGKPFSLVELQARVRALLRRTTDNSKASNGIYIQVADVIIDLKARSVHSNGQKIELTPKEFSLLLNFCEYRNRVFTKYQLLDIIWETNLDIESNVIEVNIMNIRKKLEKCNSGLKILSKRNVGYWLET